MEDLNEITMTEEEEQQLLMFFENNSDNFFIPSSSVLSNKDSCISDLLWDDFKAACAMSNKDGVFSYTVVECAGGMSFLISGWHLCDRIGYYLTNKEIVIPEEGLRYF